MTISPDYAVIPDRHTSSGSTGGGQSQITYYTPVNGYSPSQIAAAYGFNQITDNGAGTTIAIVDAYNDPKISSDLRTFDANFGLAAPPSFTQVSQTGGSTTSLRTDAGWSLETALDVEWAHAMAPGANIVLVESKSDSLTDLLAAVDQARNNPNVSVVSMSWGGSEFAGETADNSYFTTPSGHIPITFVAASGDSGAYGGVQWPASSNNVMSVGGTTLYSLNSSGAYGTEAAWSGSTGGKSAYSGEPAYQASAVGNLGARGTPDVAYDADPNTGFAVYDSVTYQGQSGWQVIGGTSAGSPQWAALIAVANQERIAAKLPTLDGVTEALPALYESYAAPGAAGYGTYATVFHDVSGGGGSFFFGNGATQGYDLVTGLGSPNAVKIVSELDTATPVPGAGTTGKAPTPPSSNHRFSRFDVTGDSTQPAPATSATTPQPATLSNYALAANVNTGGATFDSRPLAISAAETTTIHSAPAHHYDAAVWTAFLGTTTADVAAATSQTILATETAASHTAHAAKLVSVKLANAVAGAPAAEVAAETHVWLQLANLDASVFADSFRAFAHESAALEASALGGGWSRSVAVTAAAILSDTILVGYWYFGRQRRKARAAAAAGETGAILAAAK